jgi:hypothetical protein
MSGEPDIAMTRPSCVVYHLGQRVIDDLHSRARQAAAEVYVLVIQKVAFVETADGTITIRAK